MNPIQRIAKNIGISGISQITVAILTFFLLIYIARFLGEAEFGIYSFAISFTSLFTIFADIGISQLIIREISRDENLTDEYLINSFIIKFILAFITFALISITINLMGYPQNVIKIVYLFGIYTILVSFAQMFISIFQAYEKMEYAALILILEKIILISLGIFVMISGKGLTELGLVYVFAGIIEVLIAIIITSFKISKPKPEINLSTWKKLTIGSIPFGLNTMFALLFFKIDTVLLSILKDDVVVGIYNAAYNPILALSFIVSGIITSTIYPVMSRYFTISKDSLETITLISSKYLAIIGFPITIFCLVFADILIDFFYAGNFIDSIGAFQILALCIPIRLVSTITGTHLTSINKQGLRTLSVSICAILNIILNLILIPYISYIGASIATVLSELSLYFIFIFFIDRYYKKIGISKILLKPLIASLTMGIVLIYLKDFNIIINIILAALIYLVVLIILNTFTKRDKILFKGILKKANK